MKKEELIIVLKTLSVGPAGVWTTRLPLPFIQRS